MASPTIASQTNPVPAVPLSGTASMEADGAALQHRPWRSFGGLSSGLHVSEQFLAGAGFDRAPWLAVAFAAGISAWFILPAPAAWLAVLGGCLLVAVSAWRGMAADGALPHLRQALVVMALAVAGGCLTVWAKSAVVGVPAIARPIVATLDGRILGREERPAEKRVRLIIATREPGAGRAIRVRLNLPADRDRPQLQPGTRISVRARLMPPAAPLLPGGYDFARAAWFGGLAATGAVLGSPTVIETAPGGAWLASAKADLSRHVRERLGGSAGGIAAALVTGDRGGIAESDDVAMRDAGLAHLLSISGLHVSAVIGAVYFLAMRGLALWPWLALRTRLPLLAAGMGASAGIGYTLLTGAEVPTVRSCVGAVLVLVALAMGREPLSLRMLAVGAGFVMLLWPEAVVGPSFQMSFAAVIAIVSLHGSAPARRWLAPREEGWLARAARHGAMLLVTGVVIELALMPIGLFHFHRAGVYGALANVVAIPLTTLATMPLVAAALALDTVGAGWPAWWLAGLSLDILLGLARWTSAQPGAVTSLPAIGAGSALLFAAGGLWLALWRGPVRAGGMVPLIAGALSLATIQAPDVLVSGDGRHVGIVADDGALHILRGSDQESYAHDVMAEVAGMDGDLRAVSDWPGARCNRDFCAVDVERRGRTWRLLLSRGRDSVPERALAAACDKADIVVSDRWLPASCRPAWSLLDRDVLERTGGVSINLREGEIRTVAQGQGEHGWWRNHADAKRIPVSAANPVERSSSPEPVRPPQ